MRSNLSNKKTAQSHLLVQTLLELLALSHQMTPEEKVAQAITFSSETDDDDEAPQSPVLSTRQRHTPSPIKPSENNNESSLRTEWREAVRRRDEYLEEVHVLTMKVTQLEEQNTGLVKRVNELEREKEDTSMRVRGLVGIVEGMRKREREGVGGKVFVEKLAANHAKRTAMMLRFQKKMAEIDRERVVGEILREKEVLEERVLGLEREIEMMRGGDCGGDEELGRVREKVERYQRLIEELARERNESQVLERENQERIHLLECQLKTVEDDRRQRDDVSYANVKERERKRAIIDAQDAEIFGMRERIANQDEEIASLKTRLNDQVELRKKVARKHQLELRAERTKSRQEVDRLGKLFTTMLHDFTDETSILPTIPQDAPVHAA